MVEHRDNALFCVLLSLFVAADKLQYQSLDAVNKEGMFIGYQFLHDPTR